MALYRSLYDKGYHLMFLNNDSDDVNRYELDTLSNFDKFKNYIDNPVNIIDNIYIGSAYNAANYYLLKENNIGLIVNITEEIQNYFPDNFEYYNISILDINNHCLNNNYIDVINKINSFNEIKKQDMEYIYSDEIKKQDIEYTNSDESIHNITNSDCDYDLLKEVLSETDNTGTELNNNILIHCYMGASRSAAIIVAYLIIKKKMNLNDSLRLIKKLRKSTNINSTFIKELKELENKYLN
jgi:protein-tyrosine phosphatase